MIDPNLLRISQLLERRVGRLETQDTTTSGISHAAVTLGAGSDAALALVGQELTLTLPAGGGITDITYADLVTAIGADGLTEGGWYRITDYATKHYIVDAAGTAYTTGDGVIVGTTEPLIVLALSADTLGIEAHSETYPQDIIYYDWNPDNWLTDLSFATGGDTIILGFKGVITFRRDTIFDNYAPGDWRNCKSRRWATNATAWDSGTTYGIGDVVSHASTDMVYRALAASTNQEPAGADDGFWIVLLDISTYVYRNASPSMWFGVTSGTGYDDFTMFSAGQPRSIHIGSLRDDSVTPYYPFSTLLGNNVFLDAATCYENAIDSAFYFNTVETGFIYNVIGMGCALNNIGSTFAYDNIGALFNSNSVGANFSYNVIGAQCAYNYIGSTVGSNKLDASFTSNTIGGGFASNTIGAACSTNVIGPSAAFNVIGASFGGNNIGAELLGNTIGASCSTNVIGSQFQNNIVGSNFGINAIGNGFANNSIGANFRENSVATGFVNNSIGAICQGNIIVADFQSNFVAANAISWYDFSAATLIYAAYNCWLYVDATLGARLYYYSNDVLTFAAVTD